jgi:hypothetical protein
MTLALSVFSFVPVIKHPNPRKGLNLNGIMILKGRLAYRRPGRLRSLKSFEDGKGMQRARDGYIGLLFSTFSSAPHQA